MKKERFHENVEECCGGRLLSNIQSGPVRARGGEGSKSHPRGKQWLTVYRAPQVVPMSIELTDFEHRAVF